MEAIRQFVRVKNQEINITLPDDFNAEEVEVIILPKQDNFELTDEMKAILDERVNEPIEDYITSKESLARIRKKYDL